MSSKTLIMFDASIKKETIGLGVYDYTNDRKVFKSVPNTSNLSIKDAETLALILSLQYINEFNIAKAHLFTDNMDVYNTGITKNLLKKYAQKMNSVELFWIPREFNSEADYLSKQGSKEVAKTNINDIISSIKNTNKSLKEKLIEYPVSKRLNLCKRLAITSNQMNFINSNFDDIVETTSEDKLYFALCRSLLPHFNIPGYTKSSLVYGKLKISNGVMESVIRARTLI